MSAKTIHQAPGPQIMSSPIPLDPNTENARLPSDGKRGVILPSGPPVPLPNHSSATLNDPVLSSLLRFHWTDSEKNAL